MNHHHNITNSFSPSQICASLTIQEAHWPESCPPEEGFLSVITGNTHCKFAYHDGSDYRPRSFWSIPVAPLSHNNHTTQNNRDSFLESIPHQCTAAQALWKSPNDTIIKPLTRAAIYYYRVTTKRIPTVTIYLISTNPVHESILGQWLQGLPVRCIRLRPKDVVSMSLPYPTMGMDRFVAVQAISKYPALIVDGGTALTTTVLNENGHMVGGTIAPGLYAQCRALHMGNLPLLTPDEIQQFMERNEPLPLWANNTHDAMWNGVMRSTALFIRAVVREFLQQYHVPAKNGSTIVHVIVTGSDGPFLMKFLKSESCHRLLAQMPRDSDFECDDTTVMEYNPHLLHFGITQILLQHRESNDVDESFHSEWIGLRVARNVGRGYVDRVEQTENLAQALFHVVYDHGCSEVLGVLAFYDALIRYSLNGESIATVNMTESSAVERKQKEAERAAALLVERCAVVKEHKESTIGAPPVFSPEKALQGNALLPHYIIPNGPTPVFSPGRARAPPSRKRGRPRKNSLSPQPILNGAIATETSRNVSSPQLSSISSKRGRPRKNPLSATLVPNEAIVAKTGMNVSVSQQSSTPRKRGRPRTNPLSLQPVLSPGQATKRGRPRKSSLSLQPVSNQNEATVTEKDLNTLALPQSSSRKRGRPRKDSMPTSPDRAPRMDPNDEATASQQKQSTPHKVGRPRKNPMSSNKQDRRRKEFRNTLPDGVLPTDYVHRRVAKFFGDGKTPFYGKVESYDPESQYWKILYDDGDEEEMEFYELVVQLKCYEENNNE
ncbi:type III pantothenate kinase [Fistulifera solaris]|uniref:Type III pantothenate kinase n=1 Tax=Fistulifera solaris TaxID=1519565 RepID=A0A1Z5JPT4_FISSO|nr:type III pantothenate kinase [Fistulifera solaris]|eukprot:GAX15852.1 type III pantothenate kinase [Fistulifera solaris]